MKRYLRLITLFFLLAGPTNLLAQQTGNDFLRNIGKIYVVVAVITVVFIGVIIFLIYLDRKLTKIENQINQHD